MAKVVEGYVLDVDTAAPIPSVPVTLFSSVDDHTIVAAEAYGLTVNPATSDGNGHFKISMDLSPGPVYVDAEIVAGKHQRRYGLETMQLGDHWLTDVGTLLRAYNDGVIAGVLNQMAVTCSGVTNQFTVATGDALIQGYTFTLESASFSKTITPNTTIANRRAIVVLRQYIGGPYLGKQEIDILYGNVSTVDPAVRQNVTVGSDVIWEFPLARLNTAQFASVSTVLADLRQYSSLGMTIYDGLVPVVGSARGLDFSGSSFVITDEGSGIALVTPSFGTGAADFKRGNAQTDGIRNGRVATNVNVLSIGNLSQFELAHIDVALDPLATYDAEIFGWATVVLHATGTALDYRIWCSLDIPFSCPGQPTDAAHVYNTASAATSLGGNAAHKWTVRGISGVSTIRAYLYLYNMTSTVDRIQVGLDANFVSRL